MNVLDRALALSALADPARLRIVDILDTGDASPTELRNALGMSSNLLAHHLGVLEDRGIVTRHRSHADRRRTYLRLRTGALDGLLPGAVPSAPGEVSRVVFVCTANSARSQLATALWRRASSVPTTSGGTHPADDIAPGVAAAARRHGLALLPGRPRSLDGVLRGGDFVVTVCDAAHEEGVPGARAARLAGMAHWSVPDPVAEGTDEAFDNAYIEIEGRVIDLAARLHQAPSTTTTHPVTGATA